MSDHFPYFSVLDIMKKKDHKPKFVEIRNYDATSFALFQNEVASAMASHGFENDLFGDPDKNYSIFDDIISNAKHKHLQPKTVRFKWYKHKLSPWMTKGILVQQNWEISYFVDQSQHKKHLPITPFWNTICLNIRHC